MLSPARAARTRLRTGALSKQSGPAALRLLRLFTVSAGMLGVLALTRQAAAQCTPVAAQAAQPGEPVMCQCRIGPVTIEAPVCEIKTRGDDDERAEYIDWKNENGIWQHIIVKTPKHPRRFKGYLNRWLHHRKCTGEERQIGNPSRFEGAAGPGDIPAQITWTGCCAAPVCYTARAIAVGHQVVELHSDSGLNYRWSNGAGQEFLALIGRVRLSRPPSR